MQPSVQQPISKDKNVMAQARKKLFKKQLFDLEFKGQGPTKVITVRDTPPYGHAPTYQISLTLCLPLMQPSVQQPISKDKNVMAQTRKYYLKNNYLTLRSKVKVP
jgi:hypothetical protein